MSLTSLTTKRINAQGKEKRAHHKAVIDKIYEIKNDENNYHHHHHHHRHNQYSKIIKQINQV
jgi:hypothetical protein